VSTISTKFQFQLADPTDVFDNDKFLKGNFQQIENLIYSKTEVDGLIVTGSNVNGNYVKFPDGTLIQWFHITFSANGIAWGAVANAGTTYYYTSTTWTFPVTFASGTPISVHVSGDIPTVAIEQHKAYNPTTTNCKTEQGVLGIDPTTMGATTCYKSLLAIGRWK
jgi:hypothetical protein